MLPYLLESTYVGVFKSNFVQINHFDCLILFKDAKI